MHMSVEYLGHIYTPEFLIASLTFKFHLLFSQLHGNRARPVSTLHTRCFVIMATG